MAVGELDYYVEGLCIPTARLTLNSQYVKLLIN